MIEVTGNLFDYTGEAIGHGVNLQGVMGAGIAAEFRRRYPEMMPSYEQWCQKSSTEPGSVLPYRARDNTLIMNLASQDFPGRSARYDWLTTAVTVAVNYCLDRNIRELALPRIGCGIGGLHWEGVRVILRLIEDLFTSHNEPFEFVIYTPEEAPNS